ncbi:MAG: metallophosphoesterase [Pseudomonadota bacterium]
MFRLAHLSDIHLAPLPKVGWSDLLSKRFTGYLNWQRSRASQHLSSTLDLIVSHMQSQNPDHIAVTGDLTNLSLDKEYEQAARWLETLGSGEDVSVVPGNHDAYLPNTLERGLAAWQRYCQGDVDTGTTSPFPYVRRHAFVSLIGLNTGVPKPPFMATGTLGDAQLDTFSRVLESEKGRFRIVMIHHAPFENATGAGSRLTDDIAFRDVVNQCGAELILHGHTHLISSAEISGTPVIGVPSASQAPGHRRPAARYNLFSVREAEGGWTFSQEEFGINDANSAIEKRAEREFGVRP